MPEAVSTPLHYTLAIDAMGGDHAPVVVVEGLAIALRRHPTIKVLLIGDRDKLDPLLHRYPAVARMCTVRHASGSVGMDMKPASALRMKDSSMRLAIQAVADGEADGVVSAGNSGALLALSKIIVKTLPGVIRPAMAAVCPTRKGDLVMLDLGANVTCDWRNLVQFAVMGDMFARVVLGLPAPSIGLLNVGTEEQKGDDIRRQAAESLRESPFSSQFHGFVEGHDITLGTTDIVVTDGFSGNIALKSIEGAAMLAFSLFKKVFQSDFRSRLGYFLVRPRLRSMMQLIDPRQYNGAVFIGLNGIVVKSHGGTDSQGFASAIDVAVEMVTHKFNDGIRKGLKRMEAFVPIRHGEEIISNATEPHQKHPNQASSL